MGVSNCSQASGVTQDSCKACCTAPPDGVQHSDIWKAVCNFMCWVHTRGQGVPAGGVHNYLNPGNCNCNKSHGMSGLGFAARPIHYKYIPGFVGMGAMGATGDTTTPAAPFYKICSTPSFTIPEWALYGVGALAVLSLLGKTSPVKKTAFNVALLAGGLSVAGSVTGCIKIQ